MILDHLRYAERYTALHPGFAPAFEYLAQTPLQTLAAGRHEIDGDRLFVMINRGRGRGHAEAKLETHRRYIDIQMVIEGTDDIGWKPAHLCQQVNLSYSPEQDLALFADPPTAWLAVAPQNFAIFFPEDAHAPMGGEDELTKAVVKVAINWNCN